jgi:hypothetical protein
MRSQLPMWTILLTLISCGRGLGGEFGEGDEPPRRHFLQRIHPAGGWDPYGGGIFHWWNPHCFPCQTVPDDYCRKPLPRVCWQPSAPSYVVSNPTPWFPVAPSPIVGAPTKADR